MARDALVSPPSVSRTVSPVQVGYRLYAEGWTQAERSDSSASSPADALRWPSTATHNALDETLAVKWLFGNQWGLAVFGMTAGAIVLSRSQLGFPA
jgi:hypothetical protein